VWKLVNEFWNHDPRLRPTFEKIVESLKTRDDLVFPGTDMTAYHEYQARRLGEKVPPAGPDRQNELAALLGWPDIGTYEFIP
jgi:hypothetical protein